MIPVKSHEANIVYVSKNRAIVRVADYLFDLKREESKVTIYVWTGVENPVLAKQLVIVEKDASVGGKLGDPFLEDVVDYLLKNFVSRWDEYVTYFMEREVVQLYLGDNYKGPPPRTTPTQALATAVAELLMRGIVAKTFTEGNTVIDIYCFDGVVYEPCRLKLVEKIAEIAEKRSVIKKYLSKQFVDIVLSKIEYLTQTELGYVPGYVALGRKLLNWRTFLESGSIIEALEDPDPEKVVLHKIPCEIDLEAWRSARPGLEQYIPPRSCGDLIMLMKQLAPATYEYFLSIAKIEGIGQELIESRICFLAQMAGRMMLPGYRVGGVVVDKFKNVFVLLGPGDSGKSTFLQTYLGDVVLGKENWKVVNLARMTSQNPEDVLREFHDIRNALMVVHPDLGKRHKIVDWSIIRTVSGGDRVKARGVYRDAYEYEPPYKIALSANDPPEINETGEAKEALLARIKAMELRNRFTGMKLDVTPLREEAGRAIIAFLYAVYLLYKRGWADTGARDVEDLWLRYSNPLYRMITEMLERGIIKRGESISTSEFYQLLTEYAEKRPSEEGQEEEEAAERLPDQGVMTRKLKEWAARLGIRVKHTRQGNVIEGFSRSGAPF